MVASVETVPIAKRSVEVVSSFRPEGMVVEALGRSADRVHHARPSFTHRPCRCCFCDMDQMQTQNRMPRCHA